ncbi:8972_t:CDS:2 [Scutellospora calospora]|uniref:8972_t:CDS:1 n=1 Tax=Scutellospora calospora TaxID=85575 RepID=A0ACA9K5Q4_9GLOM|nr:8972_t:CDS:2 [Scutellospora calospora]
MDYKRNHIPRDTIVVSRKSIFDQLNNVEMDEINIKENIEKRLFERLQEVITIEDINHRKDDDNQYMQENQQDILFRLFARDPPTKISLEFNDIKDYNKQVEILKANAKIQRDEVKRLEQIIDTAITSSEVIMQSKIPWERNFVQHKVLHVPSEDPKKSSIKRTNRLNIARKNKTHGGICPGWPRGGKGYAYGWRVNSKFKIKIKSRDLKVRKREIYTKKGIGEEFSRVL